MRWDHKAKSVSLPPEGFEKGMNDLLTQMGKEEWELVAFEAHPTLGKNGLVLCVFKKPAAPEPAPVRTDLEDLTH